MTKDPKFYLGHILESIEFIEGYIQDVSFSEFAKNQEKQDAVLKRLEIIGEACKNILGDIRAQYSTIPWRELAGMRDIIIHQYFRVDLDLVWEVITKDLIELKEKISKIKL